MGSDNIFYINYILLIILLYIEFNIKLAYEITVFIDDLKEKIEDSELFFFFFLLHPKNYYNLS